MILAPNTLSYLYVVIVEGKKEPFLSLAFGMLCRLKPAGASLFPLC